MPGLRGGVDPFLQAGDVVIVEQPPASQWAVRLILASGPATVGRQHVPRHSIEPAKLAALAGAVGVRRVDHSDEHFGRQVGHQVGVVHPPGDEPGDSADIRAIESLERVRVTGDAMHMRPWGLVMHTAQHVPSRAGSALPTDAANRCSQPMQPIDAASR